MPRQLRAEQTRATIITAAADLIDRHGYESTSLSDIVAHAKVTKGALYFHFAAKEDLAHAILELQAKAARQLVADVESRGGSSLEALMRTTFGIARLAVEDPVPRAGLRLATADIAVRPRCGTRSPSGSTSPPASSPEPSGKPMYTAISTSASSPTPSSASSSAPGSRAARSNRPDGCRAESPRCGTS